jgi:hypothetical protein
VAKQTVRKTAASAIQDLAPPQQELTPEQAQAVHGGGQPVTWTYTIRNTSFSAEEEAHQAGLYLAVGDFD